MPPPRPSLVGMSTYSNLVRGDEIDIGFRNETNGWAQPCHLFGTVEELSCIAHHTMRQDLCRCSSENYGPKLFAQQTVQTRRDESIIKLACRCPGPPSVKVNRD